jgi:crotonobetainyl-CoA:carnitine CoA-transferase CaiB-like acyl-CoA transferase
MGNRHPTIVPYEMFSASDGDFVLAVGNDDQWRRFCAAAAFPADERFATNRGRVTEYATLKPMLDAHLRRRSRQEWMDCFDAAGVPCGSVRDLHEVFTDPQLIARGMIADVEHSTIGRLKLLGVPMKLSNTPAEVKKAPPTLGQHTDAVLQHDLGMTAAEVTTLRQAGVI